MSEYKLTLLYKKGLDYKTRNFIILCCLFVLTIVMSILTIQWLKNTHTELQIENSELTTKLTQMTTQIQNADPLNERLKELQEELFYSDKILPDVNNTTITLSYIFSIFDNYRNYFDFDFQILSSGEVPEDREVHYKRYVINGETYINLLYSFLDQLERQPSFYTIESIQVTSSPPEYEGKVAFHIEFNAYYTKTGTPYEQITLRSLSKRRVPYNIFYPRMFEEYAAESEADLPTIDQIKLVGMTKQLLFYKDLRNNKLETMEVGARVKYGILESINWSTQEAVFRLNRIGLSESVRVKIS